MSYFTLEEICHGVALLQEAHRTTAWDGAVSAIPIDEVCKWNQGSGPCGKPVRQALVLRFKNGKGCHCIAFCDHHADALRESVAAWRRLN